MRVGADPQLSTIAMKCKLISFDLDGTLVDTAGEIAYAANQTLADAGLAPHSLEQITRRIGGGARILMRGLLADAEATGPVASALAEGALARAPAATSAKQSDSTHLLQRFEHHYAQIAGTLARPYPGCINSLAQLRALGIRLVCVTNKEQLFARQVLHATGLDAFFDLLIGGDTLAHKKPHRMVLDHVLQRFHCLTSEMAHVGDSTIDVQAARNSGVAAWAVSYGYNAGVPIAAAQPDLLFDALPDIAHHVAAMQEANPH